MEFIRNHQTLAAEATQGWREEAAGLSQLPDFLSNSQQRLSRIVGILQRHWMVSLTHLHSKIRVAPLTKVFQPLWNACLRNFSFAVWIPNDKRLVFAISVNDDVMESSARQQS